MGFVQVCPSTRPIIFDEQLVLRQAVWKRVAMDIESILMDALPESLLYAFTNASRSGLMMSALTVSMPCE